MASSSFDQTICEISHFFFSNLRIFVIHFLPAFFLSPVEGVWRLRELQGSQGPQGSRLGGELEPGWKVLGLFSFRPSILFSISYFSFYLSFHFFAPTSTLISASSDKTGCLWDVETGESIKKLRNHKAVVNACAVATRTQHLYATAGDDGNVKLWDSRKKSPAFNLSNGGVPVTAVQFGPGDQQVFSGGVDNVIKAWDLRTSSATYQLVGHTDTVTGLRLSPDETHLLSNAMDETVRIWDIKPFSQNRLVKQFEGATHGNEKQLIRCAWSPDGARVVAGGGDRSVNVWDVVTRRLLYKLPGHKGAVIDVDFHPKEPIIASAGADKQIFLGEV